MLQCLGPMASMTSILISRFILNLREVYTPGDSATGSLRFSRFSDIQFANSIIGNLGAPLRFGEEEEESLDSRPEGEGTLVAIISDNPMEYYSSTSLDGTTSAPFEEDEVSG